MVGNCPPQFHVRFNDQLTLTVPSLAGPIITQHYTRVNIPRKISLLFLSALARAQLAQSRKVQRSLQEELRLPRR
ncbi:hypothetical protein ACLOJK_010343 [Asimina triloba]